jgi:CheY-like chemotaxis protein
MTKILLVEDNQPIRDMLDRRLKKKNFEVVLAVDGLDACNKAQSEQPDVILMDMHLPELDGWEATRRLKAAAATRHIPIIALTGHAFSGSSRGAAEAGADAFLAKPCLPEKLIEKMQQLLRG